MVTNDINKQIVFQTANICTHFLLISMFHLVFFAVNNNWYNWNPACANGITNFMSLNLQYPLMYTYGFSYRLRKNVANKKETFIKLVNPSWGWSSNNYWCNNSASSSHCRSCSSWFDNSCSSNWWATTVGAGKTVAATATIGCVPIIKAVFTGAIATPKPLGPVGQITPVISPLTIPDGRTARDPLTTPEGPAVPAPVGIPDGPTEPHARRLTTLIALPLAELAVRTKTRKTTFYNSMEFLNAMSC